MEAFSICESISARPHCFLRPSHQLHIASRLAAKNYLDPLARSPSKLRGNRVSKKSVERRRRTQPLYVDGFSVDQIWEQAVRIISDTSNQLNNDITISSNISQRRISRQDKSNSYKYNDSKQGQEFSASENEASQTDSDDGLELEQISEDVDASDDSSRDEELMDVENMSVEGSSSNSEDTSSETYVQDPFNLNDGFFSIDEFNKTTEHLEKLDAKGAQDEFTDEEEIDWHVDPAAIKLQNHRVHKKPEEKFSQGEDGQSSTSEDGPTFGNANLMDDESDEGMEDAIVDQSDWIDTTEIKYSDFFAPPPRKATRQKVRPLPKTQPSQVETNDDIEIAISDVRRDLFEDVSDDSDQEADMRSGGIQAGQSTHERQRAKIADEIRRLELENVAEKEWMLAGEAKAAQRPVNSLIENDLDFERVGKPVPVVTNETSEAIEQLIKQRILAKDFDEVTRRLPDMLQRNEVNRGRVDVDQSKSQQSLAELYEKDHLRMNDPDFVDAKDKKLKLSHAEIENLWRNTSSLLDSLSNWHYKPKIPQPDINVITDVATVMMEEARPNGTGTIREQGTLAPQEIYNPKDKSGFGGEVVSKSGVSMAKDELSREEKSKRRRQQKEKFKNSKSPSTSKTKTDEGRQILTDLKKGGVNIVGEKGEVQTLEGQHQSRTTEAQAGRLKL